MEGRQSEINVWVNGSFDVLHIGHIRLLKHASTFGKLRVGIDTDDRISKLKGEDRPFNNLSDRKEMLESLIFVDSVVSFNTDEELIDQIKKWSPKYMVIGSDYKNKNIIGSDEFDEIIFFERIENYSTTKILENENTRDW